MQKEFSVNQEMVGFIGELFLKLKQVQKKHFELYGKPLTISRNAEEGIGVAKDALKRRKRCGDAARVTGVECFHLAKFGEWMMNLWHEMEGTDPATRPDITRFYRPSL